jgi:ribonuclease P protein component
LAKQFTLGKGERLKSRKAIDQLFKEGQRFSVPPFRVCYQFTAAELKFGITVSAKNFKKAVDRNRVKRLSREAWRLQKNELQQAIIEKHKGLDVFLIYTAKELPDHSLIANKVGIILKKFLKLVNETPAANS